MIFPPSLSKRAIIYATYMWSVAALLIYFYGTSSLGFKVVFLVIWYPVMLWLAPRLLAAMRK